MTRADITVAAVAVLAASAFIAACNIAGIANAFRGQAEVTPAAAPQPRFAVSAQGDAVAVVNTINGDLWIRDPSAPAGQQLRYVGRATPQNDPLGIR